MKAHVHPPKLHGSFKAISNCVRPSIRSFSTTPRPRDDAIAKPTSDGSPPAPRRRIRPLPIPPLMDPKIIAARNRWKKRKQLPVPADITAFREKVNNNPYVRALATPVRQCHFTKRIMPSFFLRDAHIKHHPETGERWFLPIKDFAKISPKPIAITGHAARFYNRHSLVSYVSNGPGPYYIRTVGETLERTIVNAIKNKAIVWREDMADVFLKYSRQVAVRALKLLLRRRRKVEEWAVRVESPEVLSEHADVACLLYLGPGPQKYEIILAEVDSTIQRIEYKHVKPLQRVLEEVEDAQNDRKGAKSSHHPLPAFEIDGLRGLQPTVKFPTTVYPTVEYKGKQVALYHLNDLLGEEGSKEVVEGTKFADARWIALKNTTSWPRASQMYLLRLQGYLHEWA